MSKCLLASLLAAGLFVTSSEARADETANRAHRKQSTGIVLTSVGGSLLLTAPLVVLAGIAYVQASPYSYAAIGPITLGAMGGATIGLGMLIPGIVMTVTCRQPTWTDTRPQVSGLRAMTLPILSGSF